MSNTRSDSSESISIYETPINSPSNESLLGSTRIDSSLFGNTSANTQSIDVLDFRQSFESLPTSAATESTLRQTIQRLNSEIGEDIQNFGQSTDASLPGPSVWYSSQTMSSLRNPFVDHNRTDLYVMLVKYISELESEELELIGVEQQMQSLSIKCRTIRENMSSKTKAIQSLITEMLPKKTQTAQKQTQTDFEDIKPTKDSVLPSYDSNKCIANEVKRDSIFPNFSETKIKPKMVSREKCFEELSDSLKKKLSRLPAMVKGYLTRRLMKTEKVLLKIETIRDTTQLLSNYRNTPSKKLITPQDINFHKRLIIQLESSCHELYDIFFNYPKSSQMALIHRSREHILDRHYRTASVLSNSSYLNASFRSAPHQSSPQHKSNLSSVTKKVIQRKTQKSRINSHSKKSNPISSATKSRSSASTSTNVSLNTSFVIRRSQRNTSNVETHKRKANFDNK